MSLPRVWLPAVRAGSGADVFTQRLARLLAAAGGEPVVTWLPRWAELAPRLSRRPAPPGAQIVHVNSWLGDAFGPGLRRVVTVHHCVHDPAFDRYRTGAQRLYHRWHIRPLERRALAGAAAITAVSANTRRAVLAEFGERPIAVVPNWVDTTIFRPAAARARGAAFRLLFTGNWGARKGTALLAELMRRLGLGFELTFTTGRRGLPPPAALPPNMRWAGRIADEAAMVRLYQDCDVLVMPSRLEGFGYAALEAMACGTPVVAFATGALPEVVDDGVTGTLAPADDVAALAAACRALADTPARRHAMGEAARIAAVERFSAERALAQYRAIYERALATP